MNQRMMVYRASHCRTRAHNESMSGEAIAAQDTVNAPIDVLTISGESVQEQTVQGRNLCPPLSSGKWVAAGDAAIEGEEGLITPTSGTALRIDIPWNRGRRFRLWFKARLENPDDAGKTGATTILDIEYRKDGARIGSNGMANSLSGEFAEYSNYFGGDGVYGDQLEQSDTVRVIIYTIEDLGLFPYRVTDVFALTDDHAINGYEPFVPDSPSPEYPSPVRSVEGELAVTGRNLFDRSSRLSEYAQLTGDYTITHDGDREILRFRQSGNLFYLLPEGVAKPNTRYTVCLDMRRVTGTHPSIFAIRYTDDTLTYLNTSGDTLQRYIVASSANKTIRHIRSPWSDDEYSEIDLNSVMVVEGAYTEGTLPPYIPYQPIQSIALPVLRKIGDVADAYDSLTGELTRRVGVHEQIGGGVAYIADASINSPYLCTHAPPGVLAGKDADVYPASDYTVYYQLAEPIIEQLPPVALATYYPETHMYTDSEIPPQIAATVKIIGT